MTSRQSSSNKRKNPPSATNVDDKDESNSSSSSSSKRKKQPETEKRLRRYRATMTVGIYDRIERALNQRLYLLAISKSSNESLSREYKVLGQTGNVYTVVISHIPSCTCPDHEKGHLCKHIIFVLHRVLKVSRNSPLLYQQALLTSELNEIFAKADGQTNDSSILAEQPIRDAYHAKTGDPDAIATATTTIEQKPIADDDECPICYESMINEKTNIIFCSTSCGNNMHKICFEKWRLAKLSMREPVTCPFCRVEWKISKGKPHHHHHSNSRGYLNLAAYSTTDDYDEDFDDVYFNYW